MGTAKTTRKNNTHTQTMKTNTELAALITAMPARSAWRRGVREYAIELVCNAEGPPLAGVADLKKELLNGARTWKEYSEGGCALIYDADIAERLCSPSEYRKTRNGERAPNPGETWLDVQARALGQAANLIATALKEGRK